ncbi:MAG: HAD hydrolase-like protein [Bacteroidia bacterium]|nr:HAD hydrolase-like protein [Bacteroidia bacterium]
MTDIIRFDKYKHIIWDWNGTLLDDVWLCVDVINEMLSSRGLELMSIEKYRRIFDFPVKNYYLEIGFDFNKEPFEKTGIEFINAYTQRQYQCSLQEKATDALKYFSESGFTQSVLSAREHQALIHNLEYYKIKNYFIKISGLNDNFAYGKNDSGIKLIKELNINPVEILFIGDTIHDVEVAREMACDCLLIAHGHQSLERLKTKTNRILPSLNDLIDIYKSGIRHQASDNTL